jgi:2-oxoisovalerate dehydrogenase E1 component alpha subunit
MPDGPLKLHVPEPTGRPGRPTDFAYLRVSAAGEVARPAVDIVPAHTGTMAWKLIRVLDDEGRAVGPWAPQIPVEQLKRGLQAMLRTRAFDARMLIAQRQKKMSFYMQCLGGKPLPAPMRWPSATATCVSPPTASKGCCWRVKTTTWWT